MSVLVSGGWNGLNLDRISTKTPGSRMRLGGQDPSNAPGETRTPNLLIRSQMLYPIELRAHNTLWAVQDSNL